MKKLFKIIILYVFRIIYKLFGRSFGNIVVLMYHSVGNSGWEFSITPEAFEKQIAYLCKNNYEFLTAESLYNMISGKNNPAEKSVLITFDDGYRDFMTEAMPILNKYKIPTILFVHTNRSSDRLRNNLPLLDWPEIKSLSGNFEIGSHSHSHPNLKSFSGEGLDEELDNTEQVFLRELGRRPQFFSYPGGSFSLSIAESLRKRGYKLGFTISPGLVRRKSNPLTLPRFGLSIDTSFAEFKARVSGASNWYEKSADLFRNKNKKKYL